MPACIFQKVRSAAFAFLIRNLKKTMNLGKPQDEDTEQENYCFKNQKKGNVMLR